MPDDSTPRIRAVVDTNLFVSGLINTQGHPFQLLEALRAGLFTLLISEEQRAELEDVLHRPRLLRRYALPTDPRDTLLARIDAVALRVGLRLPLPLAVRESKDDVILASALGGGAEYLVTGDQDVLVLRHTPVLESLRIVTVSEFLDILVNAAP